MDEDKIRAKLNALQQQREAYIRQAEQQIATLNGAIAALEELLRENAAEPPIK
jgi:TolA-binding protein